MESAKSFGDIRIKLSGNSAHRLKRFCLHSRLTKPLDVAEYPSESVIFFPAMTLWTFLYQVLCPDASCRQAVSYVAAHHADKGLRSPSVNTSAYIQARKRLPESIPKQLFQEVGHNLHSKSANRDLWCGRVVKSADGTGVSMPDTPENQSQFPQPSSQKDGCGFPVANLLVLFSLATGAIIDLVIGSLKVNEMTLFHRILSMLNPGDVFLGDANYCVPTNISYIHQKGVDSVLRLHKGRLPRQCHVKRLGKNDNLVEWYRPARHTKNVSQKEFKKLPESMIVRIIAFPIHIPGFRTRKVTIVTTLLDPKLYPVEEIAKLYRARWVCELNLRDIKISMKMDTLRCKSPDMVKKEIYVNMLAYNIIRTLMWNAAMDYQIDPLRLSFKGAKQHLTSVAPKIQSASSRKKRKALHDYLKLYTAAEVVPDRPDRYEPRLIKKRPKTYGRLQGIRATYKATG